jgi:hypothetical protein
LKFGATVRYLKITYSTASQHIKGGPKLQISTIKIKYLASSFFQIL